MLSMIFTQAGGTASGGRSSYDGNYYDDAYSERGPYMLRLSDLSDAILNGDLSSSGGGRPVPELLSPSLSSSRRVSIDDSRFSSELFGLIDLLNRLATGELWVGGDEGG